MNCPVDGALLEMSARQGVEIDYCPRCRGVWLDRGELDQIIVRSDSWSPRAAQERSYNHDDVRSPARPKKRRKSSFFGDLFEE
ncbi:MAG: zf-TFIIB domain-containing protein [Actinomycetota bacterium]|nr:zf-TFIIB domain-containing protein [Actinomycetota bacterium]